MGISPRIVTEDVLFTWDGVTQRLPKGQVIDVPPGSPLERAIGAHRLVPHGLPAAPVSHAVTAPPAAKVTAPPSPPAPSAREMTAAAAGEAAETAAATVAEAAADAIPEAVAGAVAHAGDHASTPQAAMPRSRTSKDGDS